MDFLAEIALIATSTLSTSYELIRGAYNYILQPYKRYQQEERETEERIITARKRLEDNL